MLSGSLYESGLSRRLDQQRRPEAPGGSPRPCPRSLSAPTGPPPPPPGAAGSACPPASGRPRPRPPRPWPSGPGPDRPGGWRRPARTWRARCAGRFAGGVPTGRWRSGGRGNCWCGWRKRAWSGCPSRGERKAAPTVRRWRRRRHFCLRWVPCPFRNRRRSRERAQGWWCGRWTPGRYSSDGRTWSGFTTWVTPRWSASRCATWRTSTERWWRC